MCGRRARSGSSLSRRAALVLLGCIGHLSCGNTRQITVVNDVTVTFDAPLAERPLVNPSARLEGAAREVRELLGHPLSIELDASLAPEYRDSLDSAVTRFFEALATNLERLKGKDETSLALARRRLGKIAVRYAPGASREDLAPRFEGESTLVVLVKAKSSELLSVGDIMWFLRQTAEGDAAAEFAKGEPEKVPPSRHAAYVKWLRGALDVGAAARAPDRKARELERVTLAIRFLRVVEGSENRDALERFLVDTAMRDLAWGHYGQSAASTETAKVVASWLERDFSSLSADRRADVLGTLLSRGVTEPHLLECAFRLAVRSVDAWRSAGHPMPGGGAAMPREFEVVVCPHPKNDRDNRSLVPHCDGGIVRLALASDAGTARLAEMLASRKDPLLVEQVLVGAGVSSGEGRPGFSLVRAVEGDAPSLRMALRVLAEDHAHGATVDIWLAELRRLWLSHPEARGSILYVLAHLDPYGNGKIDFADFAGDFGAMVTSDEAKAYLAEGYRALSLAPVVWLSFGDFSRAALLRPLLDGYFDDARVPRFSMRDPYEALVRIRHRLCEEGALGEMRDLSLYLAARVKDRPGQLLSDLSKTFDPRSCDSACAKGRGEKCFPRSLRGAVVRARSGAR